MSAPLHSCRPGPPGSLPGRKVDVSGVRALPLPSGSHYDAGHIRLSTVAAERDPRMWERFHQTRSAPAQHAVVQTRPPDGPGVVEVALLERPGGPRALPGKSVDH